LEEWAFDPGHGNLFAPPQPVLRKEAHGLSRAGEHDSATDLALVSGVRAGHEPAMAALYDRHSGVVYSVALRVLGDTGRAEDVLQDVFLQLWRNPGAFDSARGNMGAWLAVIARNRAIDALRKRRPESDIEVVVISVQPNLVEAAEQSRALQKVRNAMAAMAPPQRSALELAYFEGLTHSEIAARTGEPLGTIKTRIRAGLLALRQAVGP
jgi:RNA polymerase sigma-70 factor, ECF subfamily